MKKIFEIKTAGAFEQEMTPKLYMNGRFVAVVPLKGNELSNLSNQLNNLEQSHRKIEVINALMNGEWDNQELLKIGIIQADLELNLMTILKS